MAIKLSEWRIRMTENVSQKLAQLNAAGDKAAQKFTRVQSKLEGIRSKSRQAFSELSNQVPILGQMGAALTNPYVLAAGAVLSVGVALGKSIDAAKAFNKEFLQIRQLNLDKSRQELDNLSRTILNNATITGQSARDTSQAFFDVQSATGKYGEEVDKIVNKVGKFSFALGADFNEQIGGTVKAMNAFGFGAERLDDFLSSAFKTVQTGIVTFEQLSKVQTEFSGAAASAGQNFDSANKLFAAFTKSAKNADIAATLTKTAFQDLSKAATIKGFKSIGVELFNAKGEMLQVDAIIRQLNPKLQRMSDLKFAKFKEAVGGSEGIAELLNQVKNSGDALITTFKQFDSSKFGINQALKNANSEAALLDEKISNRLNIAMIKLGNAFTPIVVGLKKITLDIVDVLSDTIDQSTELFGKIFNTDLFNAQKKAGQLPSQQAAFTLGSFESKQLVSNLQKQLDTGTSKQLVLRDARLALDTAQKNFNAAELNSKRQFRFKGQIDALNKFISGITNPQQVGNQLAGATNVAASGGSTAAKAELKSKVTSGVNSISGGGKTVRDVRVNIERLVEKFEVKTQTVKEGTTEIARMVEEALIRAISGAELALANE